MLWANYQIIRYEQGAGRGEQGEARGVKSLISGGSGQLGGSTPQLITPQYLKKGGAGSPPPFGKGGFGGVGPTNA